MLQYRTIRYFSACCLQIKANEFFLVFIAAFFGSNSRIDSHFGRFRKARSALSVILACEGLSPFPLAVFTLARNLSFEFDPSLMFAKIRLFCSLLFGGQTLIFLHAPSVFISKTRLWFFKRFYWQNVIRPRRPPFQNSQINGWKVSCGRLGK